MIMMKYIIRIFVSCLWVLMFLSQGFAISSSGTKWSNNPMNTLDTILDESNNWRYKIQRTRLDTVSDREGTFAGQYKISNTLAYYNKYISPYLQRAVYIWLALATVALIYMWFLMVTNWVTWAWDLSKLKSKMIYVLIWVLLLTWFYAILKVVVAIMNMVFIW